MGWDDGVDTLLPTSKKVAHPEYVSGACLPLFFGSEREAYSYYIGQRYLRIEARTLTLIVCFLPTFALVSCIFLALFFHFDEATNTHCHVPNILPSISTVIGGFWETNFIWSWAIYLHALPRLIPAFAYNNVFIPRAPRRGRLTWFLIRLHATLSLVELSALLSLTYYNSDYNHLYHVVSFSIFGSTSLLYALVHLTLCRRLELHVQTKLQMQAWRPRPTRRTRSSPGCRIDRSTARPSSSRPTSAAPASAFLQKFGRLPQWSLLACLVSQGSLLACRPLEDQF